LISQDELLKLVEYNPDMGVFILRQKTLRRKAGDILGYPNQKGYTKIALGMHHYLAHRLAWLYMTGTWPAVQVDHIDLDKANNRWKNLRLATNSNNQHNTKLRCTNTSGKRGVVWDRTNKKWRAQADAANQHYQLGRFDSFAKACDTVDAFMETMHGEFYRAAS
jgi:hypothetical protein